MANDPLIPPRTKKERQAYIAGYTHAILDIARYDIKYASKWLRDMVELDRPKENEDSSESLARRWQTDESDG